MMIEEERGGAGGFPQDRPLGPGAGGPEVRAGRMPCALTQAGPGAAPALGVGDYAATLTSHAFGACRAEAGPGEAGRPLVRNEGHAGRARALEI